MTSVAARGAVPVATVTTPTATVPIHEFTPVVSPAPFRTSVTTSSLNGTLDHNVRKTVLEIMVN